MLYLPEAEVNLVCHFVPLNNNLQSSECQIRSLENGKHEVSFTPSRVGTHDLVMFLLFPTKKITIAQIYVNSPLLEGNRMLVSKRTIRKPSGMAITETDELIVCENASDSITFHASNDGKKLSSIYSLGGSKKKCLNKPCCVGVTSDNCIIVIDSGKHSYRLFKMKMDGKLIAMTNLTNKDTFQLQSPNALGVHPSGEIFVVDSDAHSIHILNSNLTFCRTFGGKGRLMAILISLTV